MAEQPTSQKKATIAYPTESGSLRETDELLIGVGSGYRRIPYGKWFINRNTPIGEDAEIWERKPHGGRKLIERKRIIAVVREVTP